jgi:hypothetical protein
MTEPHHEALYHGLVACVGCVIVLVLAFVASILILL